MPRLNKPPPIQKVRMVRDEKTTPIERIFEEVVGRKMNRVEKLALCGKHPTK